MRKRLGEGKGEKMLRVGGEEHVNKTVGGAPDSSLATHGRHNKADAQKVIENLPRHEDDVPSWASTRELDEVGRTFLGLSCHGDLPDLVRFLAPGREEVGGTCSGTCPAPGHAGARAALARSGLVCWRCSMTWQVLVGNHYLMALAFQRDLS